MRRKIFKFAVAMSLVLCAGTAVLWVDSFNRYYRAEYLPEHPKSFVVFVGRGGLAVGPFERGWPQGILTRPPQEHRWSWEISHPAPRVSFDFGNGRFGELWFHFLRSPPPSPSSYMPWLIVRVLVIPLWLPIVALAVFPSIWLRQICVARNRRCRGACPDCGYNLTGNTTGVCPECGTPVAEKAAAKA